MANMQTGKQMMSVPTSSSDDGDFIEINVHEAKKWFRNLLSLDSRTLNNGAT